MSYDTRHGKLLMFVHAEVRPGEEAAAVAALSPFSIGNPQLLEPVAVPAAPVAPSQFDPALVVPIADAVMPTENQPMRREVLRALYAGYDTWLSQKGDPDPAFRNGTAALSRALRPFSIFESPLDLLFTRERRLVQSGPFKGRYEGTAYHPTALGQAVGEELRQRGVVS